MDVPSVVLEAVRSRLSQSARGDLVGLLSGSFFSAMLLGGATAGGYYGWSFATRNTFQLPVLAALVGGVLLLAWMVGSICGVSSAVGRVNEALDGAASRMWYNPEAVVELEGAGCLLAILQFLCGSLYGTTRALFAPGPGERQIRVAAAVVQTCLDRPGSSPEEAFHQLSRQGLQQEEFQGAVRLLRARGLLSSGPSLQVAEDLAASCH